MQFVGSDLLHKKDQWRQLKNLHNSSLGEGQPHPPELDLPVAKAVLILERNFSRCRPEFLELQWWRKQRAFPASSWSRTLLHCWALTGKLELVRRCICLMVFTKKSECHICGSRESLFPLISYLWNTSNKKNCDLENMISGVNHHSEHVTQCKY